MAIGTLTAAEEQELRAGLIWDLAGQGEIQLGLHPVTSVPVVGFRGRILGEAAGRAIEAAADLLDRVPGYVILDMAACEYMSSSTLGFVARLALERHEGGQDIFVAGVNPKVRWLLSIMDLNDFFHQRATVEEAASDILIRMSGGGRQ